MHGWLLAEKLASSTLVQQLVWVRVQQRLAMWPALPPSTEV